MMARAARPATRWFTDKDARAASARSVPNSSNGASRMTAQKQAVKHLFAVTAYYGRARGHERHVKSLEDALETIQYRLEEPSEIGRAHV